MEKINLHNMLKDLELEYIKKAILYTNNNITKAAELLGMKRPALSMRLKDLNLRVPRPPKKIVNNKVNYTPLFQVHKNNIEDELYNE